MEEKRNGEPKTAQETTGNTDTAPETVREKEGQTDKQSGGSLFEGIYDRLPDISVKSVDRFIVLCVIAFIVVILIGVLKANHVF